MNEPRPGFLKKILNREPAQETWLSPRDMHAIIETSIQRARTSLDHEWQRPITISRLTGISQNPYPRLDDALSVVREYITAEVHNAACCDVAKKATDRRTPIDIFYDALDQMPEKDQSDIWAARQNAALHMWRQLIAAREKYESNVLVSQSIENNKRML